MTTALACVLIAGILPIVCTGIAKAGARGYDNHDPRGWLARQTGYRARANAAQANSFEAFPLFAAGVLAAQWMAAPQPRVDAIAMAFIAARVAYIGCFLADVAIARSDRDTGAQVVFQRLARRQPAVERGDDVRRRFGDRQHHGLATLPAVAREK